MLIVRANERPYGGARVITQHRYIVRFAKASDNSTAIRRVWARDEINLRNWLTVKFSEVGNGTYLIDSVEDTGDVRKRMKRPTTATLRRWVTDSVVRATDGCKVEPDGTCEHGAQSWLLELGIC